MNHQLIIVIRKVCLKRVNHKDAYETSERRKRYRSTTNIERIDCNSLCENRIHIIRKVCLKRVNHKGAYETSERRKRYRSTTNVERIDCNSLCENRIHSQRVFETSESQGRVAKKRSQGQM